MNSDLTDVKLIAAANSGEHKAFRELYHRYRKWIYSLAYRYCGNEHDAADVLQDTFCYFLKKFPGFVLTCRMKTFLYPVVKHLSFVCKQKRNKNVSMEKVPANIAAKQRDEKNERRELLEIVDRLPELHREVVILRFADGFELAEISRALEIPLGTVKSRLHNALEKLRKQMTDFDSRSGGI